METKTYKITLAIKDMVLHPYTDAMYALIEIQKNSGLNRARSDAARSKALSQELTRLGMSLEDYEDLQARAADPFERDAQGRHVHPAEKVAAMLVSINDTLPASARFTDRGQERSRVACSDMLLDYSEADVDKWVRYVVVNLGTGQKASNQRAQRVSTVIKEAVGTFTVTLSKDYVNPARLKAAIEAGGLSVGVGASRKMGKGRFTVTSFEEV